MNTVLVTQLVALAGGTMAAIGLLLRWEETAARPAPVDQAPPKGDPGRGVRYAFTIGMAPWTKESTRIHAAAYLRGVGFHAGILVGLVVLVTMPFGPGVPPVGRALTALVLGFSALLGAVGSAMRVRERHLRALSTIDDHVSIWLVTVFLTAAALTVWQPRLAPWMYLSAGVMLAYVPLGKIRHCMYFFTSRGYFGRFAGRRGVLPHAEPLAARGVR